MPATIANFTRIARPSTFTKVAERSKTNRRLRFPSSTAKQRRVNIFLFFPRDLPSRLRLLLCLCFLVDLFAFIKTNGRITTIRDANFRYASAQLSQAVIDRSSYAFPRSIVSASGEERHRKTSHFFFFFGKRGNVTGQGSGTNFPTANRYSNKRTSAAHYR